MMSGIEILNVIVETTSAFGWSSIGFVFGFIAVISVMVCICTISDTEAELATFFGIVAGISLIVSLCLFSTAKEINTYSYEVRVEDSVAINEFLERYEILEHRDKIYLIQELDEEAKHINRADE